MTWSVHQVDDPEALAFFLPGIASRLCKAIYQSTVNAPEVRARASKLQCV